MGDNVCKPLLERIRLRRLELTDAEPMLEWMLEPSIYEKMQYDPAKQSLEGCRRYIENSWTDRVNIHCAITNEKNEYLGTVSLKHVDMQNRNAEFAIALHPKAMGKGISKEALRLIMRKAFEELGLNKVYLYVRRDNERAVAFYKKCNLEYEGCFREQLYVNGTYKDLCWYALRKESYEEWKNVTE